MRSIGLALAALVTASPAAADMPQVQPGRYHCLPTEQSRTLYQGLVPITPGVELRLGVRLLNEMPEGQERPTVALMFNGPNGNSHIAIGQAVKEGFEMYTAVTPPGSTVPAGDDVWRYELTKKWIILKLNLDEKGWMVIRAGDETLRYKWGKVDHMAFQCHHGEWEVDVWPRSYAPAEVAH